MSLFSPDAQRYQRIPYRRSGRSGLQLPSISLGLWRHFGNDSPLATMREIVRTAFDLGITHFDLANNYGPPPGSAETHFGQILQDDLRAYRDELVISTKAGFPMWPGPYGDFGSKKHLVASLNQSLRRLGVDYVDIFYHHRPDPATALEETMGALDAVVRQGKALYVGISNYDAATAIKAAQILRQLGQRMVIHQPAYSLLNRWIERDLLAAADQEGFGVIAYSPLARGVLTNPELDRIGARSDGEDPPAARLRELADLAHRRGQTVSQLALTWVLRDPRVTSALIGVSAAEQLRENIQAVDAPALSQDELDRLDRIFPVRDHP